MALAAALQEVSATQLERFRGLYESQMTRGPPSAKAQFDYASSLVRSPTRADMQLGVLLLEDLFRKTSDESAKRDCLFDLAIAHLRLQEYDKALKYVTAILRVEPRNRSALELREHIETKRQKDAVIGAVVVGSTALLVIGGLVGLGLVLKHKT